MDRKANVRAPLEIHTVPKGVPLKLAPVQEATEYRTFQHYSQLKSQEALKSTKDPIIPERYRALIKRYPDILKQDFKAKEV